MLLKIIGTILLCGGLICGIQAQQTPDLNTRIDSALHKAMLWLIEDPDKMHPETYVVYNLLERKFNAPPIANPEEFWKKAKKNERRYYNIYPFLRLIDPTLTITEQRLQEVYNDRDQVLVRALWANDIPLPKDFLNQLEWHLTLGGYYTTHAYLNMIFLREHKHPLCETEEFVTLEKKALNLVRKYVDDHPYPGDITIESLCFLAFTDNWEGYVTVENIEKVLKAQLKNGAWHFDEFRHNEEQHTVILAMWLLYEFRYPDAKHISWIPKPIGPSN